MLTRFFSGLAVALVLAVGFGVGSASAADGYDYEVQVERECAFAIDDAFNQHGFAVGVVVTPPAVMHDISHGIPTIVIGRGCFTGNIKMYREFFDIFVEGPLEIIRYFPGADAGTEEIRTLEESDLEDKRFP